MKYEDGRPFEALPRSYYRTRSRVWKRVAKKWRQEARIFKIHQAAEFERANTWRATATRRLELLRRCAKILVVADNLYNFDLEENLIDELAKELVDE